MKFWRTREFGTALVLAGMLVACEIATRVYTGGSFIFSSAFGRLFQEATPIALAALGACVVILSGGVDLSSGAVMGLASVVLATLYTNAGWGPLPALLGGLGAGAAAGLANGLLVSRLRLPPFIATLGMLSVARGISFWISPSRTSIEGEGRESAAFAALANGSEWVLLALTLAMAVLMARFRGGRYVYAVGGNEEAARFSGLPIARIKTGIYVVAGFFAALAGCSLALRYGSGYVELGRGYELQIIAACAIGGISFSGGEGTVVGAVLGALTLQVLETLLLRLQVPSDRILIAYGAAIILAVSIDRVHHGGVLARWLGRKPG
jgi:ribose transport system permease protein